MKPPIWLGSALAHWALVGALSPATVAFQSDERHLAYRDLLQEAAQCRLDSRSAPVRPNPRLVLSFKPWADHWDGISDLLQLHFPPLGGLGGSDASGLHFAQMWNQTQFRRYTAAMRPSWWFGNTPSTFAGENSEIIAVDGHGPPERVLIKSAPQDSLDVKGHRNLAVSASAPETADMWLELSLRTAGPANNDGTVLAHGGDPDEMGEAARNEPAIFPTGADSFAENHDEMRAVPTPEPELESDVRPGRPRSPHGEASPTREITAMGAALTAVMLIFVFCL